MRVDYAAVTGRQQKVWSLGDYAKVGSLLSWMGESLVRRLDARRRAVSWTWLPATGVPALAAARRFADVLAETDYVPTLLEDAQQRARR